MFDIRLRLVSDAGEKGRILPTKQLSTTGTESGSGRVRFHVSAADVPEAPFLVGLETTADGRTWTSPRNNVLIASEDDADDADKTKTLSFVATDFVTWLMQRMHVQSSHETVEGQRRWAGKSAGHVLNVLVNEAKNNGWGPLVSTSFTAELDSNGQPWGETKDWAYQLLTPMTQVLQGMADTGWVEWWTEGTILHAVKPGTGTDLTDSVVLGGPGYSRAPSKTSFDDVFTNLTIRIDSPGEWAWLINEGADMRFGRLWSTMTQSGVGTVAEATRNAQPALIAGRAKKREQSFQWVSKPGMPVPWSEFNIGDTVTVRSRGAKLQLRVIKLDVSKDTKGKITVTVVVGDKMLSLQAKIARRTAASSMGQIISGSGDAFPATPAPDGARPQSPTGLHATDAPYWRQDGSAASKVSLGWNAVAQSTDGTAADVALYEVWSRVSPAESAMFVQTDALSTVTDLWEPEVTRLLKVRAQSRGGVWSEFSDEISVTPGTPASIVPKAPTGLAVTSNVAAFRPDGSAFATVAFTWAAVTQSTDNVPVSIVAYEVWEGTGADPGVTLLATGTPGASKQWDSGAGRYLRVRAQSDMGVWSDFSDPCEVDPATPDTLAGLPTKPVLATGNGVVAYAWAGMLTTGAPGVALNGVIAEWGLASAGPWAPAGGMMPASGGGGVVQGLAGQEVWVRYRTVDKLGRVGEPSEAASIVVAAVTAGDIDQAIIDAIAQAQADADAAQSTADGKITISVSAPTEEDGAGMPAGALWFRRTAGGVFNAQWEWTGTAWASRTIDNAVIANLDAAKINVGILNAARIGANSVGAEKLMVADMANMATLNEQVPGTIVYANWTSTVVDGWSARSTITDQHFMFRRQHGPLPFKTGDRIRVTFEAFADAPGSAELRLWTYGAINLSQGFPGAIALTTAPQVFEREVTLTIDTTGKATFLLGIHGTGVQGKDVRVRNVRAYRMGAGELIVDGGVKAVKLDAQEIWANSAWVDQATVNVLRAGVVQADMLAPNVGEVLNLSANGAVQTIINTQSAQSSQITAAQSAANQAGQTAQQAAQDAATANAGVSTVQGQVGTLQGQQAATAGEVATIQTWFRVDAEGGHMGRSDSAFQSHIKPDRFEITQDGVPRAWLEANRLVAPEFVGMTVVLSNHKLEQFGTGTVVRRLG